MTRGSAAEFPWMTFYVGNRCFVIERRDFAARGLIGLAIFGEQFQ